MTPVPASGKVTDGEPVKMGLWFPPLCEPWVLNAIQTLPRSVPADGGVNVTLQVTLWPPARVTG
jgi:hypothetical protein